MVLFRAKLPGNFREMCFARVSLPGFFVGCKKNDFLRYFFGHISHPPFPPSAPTPFRLTNPSPPSSHKHPASNITHVFSLRLAPRKPGAAAPRPVSTKTKRGSGLVPSLPTKLLRSAPTSTVPLAEQKFTFRENFRETSGNLPGKFLFVFVICWGPIPGQKHT